MLTNIKLLLAAGHLGRLLRVERMDECNLRQDDVSQTILTRNITGATRPSDQSRSSTNTVCATTMCRRRVLLLPCCGRTPCHADAQPLVVLRMGSFVSTHRANADSSDQQSNGAGPGGRPGRVVWRRSAGRHVAAQSSTDQGPAATAESGPRTSLVPISSTSLIILSRRAKYTIHDEAGHPSARRRQPVLPVFVPAA